MRQLLPLTILFSCLFSCKTKTEKIVAAYGFQLLIPDTTNNRRAQLDFERVKRCSQIVKQLGLNDLQRGTDTFEIRVWYDFSFSNSKDLYILKLLDTTYRLSYFRLYLRGIDYEDKNRNKTWNPFTHPILDSSVSKSIILKKDDLNAFNLQEVWNLHSQSELQIPDSFGFTDCFTVTMEVADKNRYKFMSHHCPNSYYEKFKLRDIINFTEFFQKIIALARKHNVILSYTYD